MLPARLDLLVASAAKRLAGATDAAGVLEARTEAGVAYTAARTAARIAQAKRAHEDVVAAAHHAQADALEIEALAERKLAEQYDRARAAGEVRPRGQPSNPSGQGNTPTMADLGLDSRMISRGRALNEVEDEDPGAIRRTLDAALDEGGAPTREDVRRLAIREAVKPLAEHMKAHGFIFSGVLHVAQHYEPLAGADPVEAARRVHPGHRWKLKQLPLHDIASWFEAFAAEMDDLEDPYADVDQGAGVEGAAGELEGRPG